MARTDLKGEGQPHLGGTGLSIVRSNLWVRSLGAWSQTTAGWSSPIALSRMTSWTSASE